MFALMLVFFTDMEEIFPLSWLLFEMEGFFIFGILGVGTEGLLTLDTLIKTSFIGINYDYEQSMKNSKSFLPRDIFYFSVFWIC